MVAGRLFRLPWPWCQSTVVSRSVATLARAGDTAGPQPMSLYGAERTDLAKVVALVLDSMPSEPRYFLDNGTLLGLWRDGGLIENDDDFDFGLLVDGKEFSPEWVVGFQLDFQARLEQRLQETYQDSSSGSGPAYKSRVVDTYAHKIEIFDPAVGSFPLQGARYGGARYHHVSVDLQVHVQEAEQPPSVLVASGEVLTGPGVSIQHADFAKRGNVPSDAYEPFGSIHFAGTDWPVPAKQESYLSFLYGFLGLGAEFDIHSTLYRRSLVGEHAGDAAANAANTTVSPAAPLRLYTDMCADLFHAGHVNYLRQCCAVHDNVHLIVGIHSDATIKSYKRAPVCTMDERVAVVEACSFVHQVLADAPLRVTEAFMEKHAIDFVVHGTETPEHERRAMYDFPITQGKYTEVPRTKGVSTTEIIDRIASRLAVGFDEHALPSERQPAAPVVRELSLAASKK